MSKFRVAAFIFISAPCFAAALSSPDTNCNPSMDPPAGGGCTWYNFYAATDGTITAGSSYTNYYVNSNTPPWTITTTTPEVLRIVDGGHQGDVFSVFDNGVPLGTSSSVPVDANHSCANDPTGAGIDPAACWNDPLMSRGTFPLAPGNHSITIVMKQMVPGGPSTLQWFEIGAPATTTSGLTFAGSMPHIASEGDWMTTFTLVNKGATPVQTDLSIFNDGGLPLVLPLISLDATPTPLLTSSLNGSLPPNAAAAIETTGPNNVPVQVGGAQLASTGTVDGFAIFHINSSSQEAVVPLETRNASSYLLAFDNTNSVLTGVALENISAQAANVNVIVRDDSGLQIGTGNVSLPASSHTSFVLSTQFPWTANIRGTAEFDTPAGGRISVLGIRYTPPGTLTTIPVLANVGTSGGSIAHIASGNGWKTTFVLVNAGASPAAANLAFFGDNGAAMALPVSFPQTGGAAASAFTVARTLAAGATLVVDANGAAGDPLQTGSAQLTTTGNVSGFVIFRYQPNGQEAVVPLESRNAGAYVLAFDNTSGTATGVALNNVSAAAANIPVIVRSEAGGILGTSQIGLGANGHTSFVLATQFPATANIRGTIEFDTPTGAAIGVLGIRTPAALTFTTLPALAK